MGYNPVFPTQGGRLNRFWKRATYRELQEFVNSPHPLEDQQVYAWLAARTPDFPQHNTHRNDPTRAKNHDDWLKRIGTRTQPAGNGWASGKPALAAGKKAGAERQCRLLREIAETQRCAR
jgi:hypothetical protein